MEKAFRKTGIDIIGDAPWGTHLCQFYQTKKDLIEILVPYFKAGLENNEFCMWITSEPLRVEEAKAALKKVVKNLDHFIKKGQIEILDYSEWYTKSGKFDANNVLQGWVEKESQALKRGYDGLRLSGNTFWLEKRDWRNFADYEEEVNNVIGEYRMIAICTYSLGQCGASEVIDVVSNHQFALISREGKWVIIGNSERKRAEEALRESEEQFRLMAEVIPAIFWMISPDWKQVKYVSPAFEKVYGRTCESFYQQPSLWIDIIHAEDRPKVLTFYEEHHGEQTELEYRIVRPDGAVRWIRDVTSPIRNEVEELILLTGFGEDITERKRAEEALRESENRFRQLAENIREVFWMTDPKKTQVFYISPTYEQIWGRTCDSLYDQPRSFADAIHPEDRERVFATFERQARGEAIDVEYRITRPDGSILWIWSRGFPVRDERGEIYRVAGIAEDITKRKRAEEALLIEKNFSEKIINSLPDTFYLFDENGKIIRWNKNLEKIFGYTSEEISNLSPLDFIAGEDREAITAAIKKVFTEGEAKREANAITKNEEKIPFLFTGLRLIMEGKLYLIGVGIDITERKRIEEEIRKFKTISDRTGYGVGIIDLDGNLLYVNESFAQMHGYTAKELIGKHFSIFHTEEQMKDVERLNKQLEETGSYVAEEVWHKRKDATVFPTLMTGTSVTDDKGKPLYLSATAIDITEGKRAEEALKKSYEKVRNLAAHLQTIREEERTSVAREIHDELGQALTALKMDLDWLESKILIDKKEILERVAAMSKMIDMTIEMVKKISAELRPGILDDFGIVAAIEWQTEEFQSRTGIDCEVMIDPEEITLDKNLSTTIFRIFQEAMTNIARHAKATKIKVNLEQKENQLLFTVKDNGKGITQVQISDPRSYGLLGIRERTYAYEGEVKVEGSPGKGTTVAVKIPLKT